MNIATKITVVGFTSLLLAAGAGAGAAFAADQPVAASSSTSALSGTYAFSQGDFGSYDGAHALTSYGYINFSSHSGDLVLNNLEGENVADLGLTNVTQTNGTITATVNGATVTMNTIKGGTQNAFSFAGAGANFADVMLISEHAATQQSPAAHTGVYAFSQGDPGTYNGQQVLTSYGYLNFGSNTGSLTLDDPATMQEAATLSITNIDQHADGTITAKATTGDTSSTVTLTPLASGSNNYSLAGAGAQFSGLTLIAE